jgi:uncharacterized protein YqeY
MSLESRIMESMKVAMKNKDAATLDALRAVKSAILLLATQGGGKKELSEEEEAVLLQKLIKQRKESADMYAKQGRQDLAATELAQTAVIETFLPEPLSAGELAKIVEAAIAQTGAKSVKEMGSVMNLVTKMAGGRADGKTIATLVKEKLS